MLIEDRTSSALKKVLDRLAINFHQLAEPQTFSGTKAHIYCTDTGDVVSAWQRIRWAVVEYRLGAKAATTCYFRVAGRHKGLTLYLPERNRVEEMIDTLVWSMDGWPIDGEIPGDVPRGNGVHTRFEFAYDPRRDVTLRTYYRLYQPAAPTTGGVG